MNIFSGLMAKVAAGFALLSGVMFLVIKYLVGRNGELKHEVETIHKKSKMQAQGAEFQAKVLANEQDEVLKMTKETIKNEKPSLDSINNL